MSGAVIPIQRFMTDALAATLRKAPMSDEKVAFAWRAAVGPAIDRGTTIAFHGGLLRVHAKDAAWQREVERSEGLIRARMDALLGRGVVRAIEVAVGQNK
jgi:Dna[CI] antecedent DciA-like protein